MMDEPTALQLAMMAIGGLSAAIVAMAAFIVSQFRETREVEKLRADADMKLAISLEKLAAKAEGK